MTLKGAVVTSFLSVDIKGSIRGVASLVLWLSWNMALLFLCELKKYSLMNEAIHYERRHLRIN